MGNLNPTVAGLIWLAFGAIVIVFGLLFVLEGILYLLGQTPITAYVRTWSWHHVFLAAVVATILVVGVSMAVTHFVLD